MKGWWLAAVVLGIVIALGAMTVVLDRLRSTVRVTPGLGDAAGGPVEDGELMAPVVHEDGSARRALAGEIAATFDLEIHVVDEDEQSIPFVEVLAYRGDELVRAGRTDGSGLARLIPFAGPGTLRLERGTHEIARVEIAEGRGRQEVVVAGGARVSGLVLVDGAPRAGIELELHDGSGEGGMDTPVRRRLERWGWLTRAARSYASARTGTDGSFRFPWLPAAWSGVLRLEEPEHVRFADGSTQLALARPAGGLTLALHELRPALVLRGRVVFRGEPVPHARWRYTQTSWPTGDGQACDEHGRFSIQVRADDMSELALEFDKPGAGAKVLRDLDPVLDGELGDVELEPTRAVEFVVTNAAGEPIAGARAVPRDDGGSEAQVQLRSWLVEMGFFAGEPTDAEGRGVVPSFRSDQDRFLVGARGYGPTEVVVPPDLDAPLPVILARTSAVEVALRDRRGRVPPGVYVRLAARSGPFTWKDGYHAAEDELALFTPRASDWSRVDGYAADYAPDEEGRVWIQDLRAGQPFELLAVDEYGAVVDAAPAVVLDPGEWRSFTFVSAKSPRRVLVVVQDALGRRVEGAAVWLSPAGGPPPQKSTLRTDRAGMARTAPLHSGDVRLRVTRYGFASRTIEHVRVPPEGATVTIRLAHDWWPW